MRAIILACALGLAGCTSVDPFYSEMPGYAPDISSGDFVAGIDNPFLPFVRGATWSFLIGDADAPEERTEVEVLTETRSIQGVETTIVRDTVYAPGGAILEETFDWFAQDDAGNVWYLGEDTCEFERGECVHKGGSFAWGIGPVIKGEYDDAYDEPEWLIAYDVPGFGSGSG